MTPARETRPQGVSWAMVIASLGLITLLNATWYFGPNFSRTNGMVVVFLAVGTLGFFCSARLIIGLGFHDLSKDTRIITVMTLLLTSCLLVIGRSPSMRARFGRELLGFENAGLVDFATLSACSILFFAVVPLLLIRFVHHGLPRDFGFGVPIRLKSSWVYLVLFVVLVPIAWYSASQWDYLASYPQARDLIEGRRIDLRAFVLFQILYAALVITGESFWRGYVIFGLKRELGYLAFVFMAMLYSISHYGKPFSETMAATVSGLVLGALALRHRSFWLGCLLHVGVALAMEVVAVVRRGVTFF